MGGPPIRPPRALVLQKTPYHDAIHLGVHNLLTGSHPPALRARPWGVVLTSIDYSERGERAKRGAARRYFRDWAYQKVLEASVTYTD